MESVGVVRTEYEPMCETYVAQIDMQELAEKPSYMLQFADVSLDQVVKGRLDLSILNLKCFIKRATEADITDIKEMGECVSPPHKNITLSAN